MANRLSGFRSADHAERYFELYDRTVATEWSVPHEEMDVPSRFGMTHVRVAGTGDRVPMLLVHPTAGSSAGWYPLMPALCADRRVYTPDTIGGAGRSIQTAPITSGSDLVEWLDGVLDELGLDRVHLVGYSEGAWVSTLHATGTAAAERLASLTLIEPAGAFQAIPPQLLASLVLRGMRVMLSRDKPTAVRRFNRWMNGDVELTDAQVDLILTSMRSFTQRLPTPRPVTDEELRRVTTPTLLILAASTKLLDAATVQARAEAHMTNVTVDVIADAGHGVGFQYPDLVTEKILTHVRAQEARR